MNASGTLTHVVLVQWRVDMPGEALVEINAIVPRFQGEIPGIVSAVEGASVSPEGLESGFEWALVVTFESAAARDGYLEHPTHAPVSATIQEWAERLVVFDLGA